MRGSKKFKMFNNHHLALATTILIHSQSRYVCVSPLRPNDSGIIAFTGTQTPKDLLVDDLDVRTAKWPTEEGCDVHRGFARRTRSMMQEMTPFLETHKSFVLTGHSLGGACAILAASALVERGTEVQSVYTFGSPRVASTSFRSLYSMQGLVRKTFNFVTPHDPVVHRIPSVYHEVCPYVPLEWNEDMNVWKHHDMRVYTQALAAR